MLLQVFSAILSGLFFASSTIGKIINMESIAAVSQPQAQDIILDVRHPANQIICLPFFQINKQLDKLDREQSYLLYCEKGIMSRLHADAMQKNGFEKVAVFVL
jgi:thiamine biosynthesis protein ThiI